MSVNLIKLKVMGVIWCVCILLMCVPLVFERILSNSVENRRITNSCSKIKFILKLPNVLLIRKLNVKNKVDIIVDGKLIYYDAVFCWNVVHVAVRKKKRSAPLQATNDQNSRRMSLAVALWLWHQQNGLGRHTHTRLPVSPNSRQFLGFNYSSEVGAFRLSSLLIKILKYDLFKVLQQLWSTGEKLHSVPVPYKDVWLWDPNIGSMWKEKRWGLGSVQIWNFAGGQR